MVILEDTKRKYEPYPEYKNSGVEWLGMIPAHWEVWKVAHGFNKIGSGTTPQSDDLSYYDGDIPWVTTTELRETLINDTNAKLTAKALEEHSALKLYPEKTLLIAMYGATIGRLGILNIPATVNQACCAFSEATRFCIKFFYYWLIYRRPMLISLSTGGGQPNLSQDDLKSLRVPLPSTSEQQAITDFLDRETTRLDELIAKKQKLIELLQEQRTALITHTVTKGLTPDAPKKYGGVEWLGEIPTHWEVNRLKWGVSLINDKVENGETDTSYLGLENVESWTGRIIESDFRPEQEGASNSFRKDDVLFGKLRPYLAKAVHAQYHGICTSELMVLRPQKYYPRYLFYYMLSRNTVNIIDSSTYGVKMPRANWQFIGNLPTPLPSLREQQAIADFLDKETSRIDNLVSRINQAVEKLQEYRSALITAAVTGKMDVRANVQ
jgi:restriction endonuclease S subunit